MKLTNYIMIIINADAIFDVGSLCTWLASNMVQAESESIEATTGVVLYIL